MKYVLHEEDVEDDYISYYYCLYMKYYCFILDHINADLVSIGDFENTKKKSLNSSVVELQHYYFYLWLKVNSVFNTRLDIKQWMTLLGL